MKFIDETEIDIAAGAGGGGCVSFRREKYVPFGGPNGGDGGHGGDVILVASRHIGTLHKLRRRPRWEASDGERGRSRQQTGACGGHLEIPVPVGTRVIDARSGEQLCDLVTDGERFVAAKGGAAGRGNLSFKTSTNRTPRKSTPGQPGESRRLRLELVLLADVGLLGFPNAGKSTLISRISAARPKIADYPFTTLVPQLGVVQYGRGESFVVADIPGLISGAAEGHGLGHRFLRHVRRTRILLHMLSLGHDEQISVTERYTTIRRELAAFDPALAERPELVVLSKMELLAPDERARVAAEVAEVAGQHPMEISAVTGDGLPALITRLSTSLNEPAP